MALHIGKLIDKKIREIGMSKSELGRRIEITPQNTHYILRRASLDTDLLRRISLALNYDFFQHYLGLDISGKAKETLVNISTTELKAQLAEIKKEISTLELHNSYLREIVHLIGPAAHEESNNTPTPVKTSTNKQKVNKPSKKTIKKVPTRKSR